VDDKADEEERQAIAEAKRRKQIRQDLADLEVQNEREERRFEILRERCVVGRAGVRILRMAVKAQSYAVGIEFLLMLIFIFGFVTALMSAVVGANNAYQIGAGIGRFLLVGLPIALLLAFASAIGYIIAMGKLQKGPKSVKHLTVMGMAICIVHLVVAVIQVIFAISPLRNTMVDPVLPLWTQMQPLYDMMGLVTELPLLSEHPARFMFHYPASWLGIVAATLEFMRLVIVCLIAQSFAEQGKSVEKGHKALRCAYKAFWLILMAGTFRVLAAISFDSGRADGSFLQYVGLIVHGLTTFVITFGLALVLNNLTDLLGDVEELVDPTRFAAKGEIYEL